MLVLGRELLRLLAQRVRRELVRRHVREVACAVRAVGDDRSPLDGCLQRGVVRVAHHDPIGRVRLVLRLPAARRVRAEDRPLDERRGLFGQRQREGLVEQPDDRSTDTCQRLRRGRSRCAQRFRVDVLARPDARRDEARRLELAVEVEENRLAALAPQLSALFELPESAAELVVDDSRALAAQRLGHGKGKRVCFRLPRKGDLDRRHDGRWYLGGA